VGLALRKGLNVVRGIAAAVISIAVVVAGYFVAGVILESQAVAALEILPNTLQALSGSVIGFPLYWAVRRAYPPLDKYSERSG
ncbi:MAG: ECF transporter S component, partial [Anaerolineae bacterium]|nr:ECF transporter S component [Anaerolineae bacterium]